MTEDRFNLARFVDAQAPVYAAVEQELRAGRKTTHWMWFVFPQITGLGHSAMAQRYAIQSRAEAAAYLAHPVLGPRLLAGVALVLACGRTAHEVFGDPDTAKFHSCLTLFEAVGGEASVFGTALDRFYGGRRDLETMRRI
jgi:uncharacterized protein (DUF1810 family)